MKILYFRNDFNANAVRQVEDEYGGVGYYRIVKPAQYTNGHSIDVIGAEIYKKGKTAEKKWSKIFKDYDVFWTTYFNDPQMASAMFYHRDKLGKKVVVDLDDNYLDVQPSHPLYDKMKPTKKDRAYTSVILSFADVITVSTEPLKQRIAEHMKKVYGLDKKIVVVPNMNDIKDWEFESVAKNKDKIVIGYAGSNSHYDDLAMMFPALADIMDKYPNVYFESMGSIGKDNINLFTCFSEDAKLRCDILPSTWTFKEYPKHLASMKWDIAVAPLVDTAFTRCKSHIKFMEYSMFKIPVIASRVYPYYVPSFDREVITHEVNGLLVKPSEWFDALERLILNEKERKEFGENAYSHIKDTWQYDDKFSDSINEVIKALS